MLQLLLSLFSLVALRVAATTYYVSQADGSDAAAGTSPDAPWQSLARLQLAALEPGDGIRLARGSVWREANLTLNNALNLTISAYGNGTWPRPVIERSIGLDLYTSCLDIVNSAGVWVDQLHLAGCSRALHFLFGPGFRGHGYTVSNCMFRDINVPFELYDPQSGLWARAVSFDAEAGNITVYNVTLRNNVATRLDSFFYSENVGVDGLTLFGNTVAQCGGNCVFLRGTNMLVDSNVFLRDTPARLFLHGTTDVRSPLPAAKGNEAGGGGGCSVLCAWP
jgi:hypothetical protein